MKTSRVALLLTVLLATSAPFAACFPSYTFGESASDAGDDATTITDASDGGATDASADGVAPTDAPADSPGDAPADSNAPACPPSALDGSVGVVTVASTGMASASGLGQPVHLVVQDDCTSWYFYPSDDGTQLLSRKSADFATWTSGDPISLGAALPNGDDFSVAYAKINGADVVHAIADVASGGETLHVRTTIASGHLTSPSITAIPNTNNGGSCLEDAPAVIVTRDGHVYDSTGWTSHPSTTCDLNIYESNGVDDGATFSAAFTLVGYYVSIPTFTSAHQLVELPEAGAVIGVMPDQDNQSTYDYEALAIGVSPFDAGYGQQASEELFYVNGGPRAAFGDWSLCRLTDREVHAVRHVLTADAGAASAFQEAHYDVTTGWLSDVAPPSSAGPSNVGLALVSDRDPSHGMVLATVGADGKSVSLQRWTSAAGWKSLPTLARGKTVQSLAGSGCGSQHASIFWTEGESPPYAIVAADVSSVLAQ